MASTHLTADNSRGSTVSASGTSYAHLKGWDAGVRVTASKDGKTFGIAMTHGTNDSGSDTPIGEVRLIDGEPVFTPAS